MATKTFKVALSLDNPRIIQSGINVHSFDKQSIKIKIELTKNSQVYQIPTGAQIKISLLKLARQEQKIILDVPFTSADSIDWIVPDYLDGYQGEVRVGIYLIVGTENIDVGYFNITSSVSDIDSAAEEFTESVLQGWAIEDLKALLPQFQAVLDETTGKDVISAPEIILARGGAQTLGERLDESDVQLAQNTSQLAQDDAKIIDITRPPAPMLPAIADNGLTDNTSAIQACINYVQNKGGGTVFFPKMDGYFEIFSPLLISTSSVKLLGSSLGNYSSDGVDIAGIPDLVYKGSDAAIKVSTGERQTEGFEMNNLWLSGMNVGKAGLSLGYSGTAPFKAVTGLVQSCMIDRFTDCGVDIINISSFNFTNTYIRSNRVGIIHREGNVSGIWSITDSRIFLNTEQGLLIHGRCYPKLLNTVFESNGHEGVKIKSTDSAIVSIAYCDFENNNRTQSNSYNISLDVASFRLTLIGNELAMNNTVGTNNKNLALKSTLGSGSFATIMNNYHTTAGVYNGGLKADILSSYISVLLLGEDSTGYTLTGNSKVGSVMTKPINPAPIGNQYIGLELDVVNDSDCVSIGKARSLMLRSGYQVSPQPSRAVLGSYAAIQGSLGFNSEPAFGKGEFWACTTGGGSPSYTMVNAPVAGWQLSSSPTPNVLGINQLKINADVTVTNFTGGVDGQHLVVISSANVTIQVSGTIITKTGANVVLTPGKIIQFYLNGSLWTEV